MSSTATAFGLQVMTEVHREVVGIKRLTSPQDGKGEKPIVIGFPRGMEKMDLDYESLYEDLVPGETRQSVCYGCRFPGHTHPPCHRCKGPMTRAEKT